MTELSSRRRGFSKGQKAMLGGLLAANALMVGVAAGVDAAKKSVPTAISEQTGAAEKNSASPQTIVETSTTSIAPSTPDTLVSDAAGAASRIVDTGTIEPPTTVPQRATVPPTTARVSTPTAEATPSLPSIAPAIENLPTSSPIPEVETEPSKDAEQVKMAITNFTQSLIEGCKNTQNICSQSTDDAGNTTTKLLRDYSGDGMVGFYWGEAVTNVYGEATSFTYEIYSGDRHGDGDIGAILQTKINRQADGAFAVGYTMPGKSIHAQTPEQEKAILGNINLAMNAGLAGAMPPELPIVE